MPAPSRRVRTVRRQLRRKPENKNGRIYPRLDRLGLGAQQRRLSFFSCPLRPTSPSPLLPSHMQTQYYTKRRVHFSDNCLTFGPVTTTTLRTPSPTHSDSQSGSDESDPPTPQTVPLAMQYVPSPYPFASAALLTSPASPGQALSLFSPSQYPTPINPPGHLSMGFPTPTPSPPHTHPLAHHHHHHHHHHHQQHVAKPAQMNVHYLIAYSPHSISPLPYNVLHPPQSSFLLPQQQQQQFELDQPATEPPLAQMVIKCPLLPDKWQILVVPGGPPTSASGMEGISSPASTVYSPLHGGSPDEITGQTRGYISVRDVLYSLYTSLRVILHPSEYESLTTTTSSNSSPCFLKESVNAAFWARLSQIDNPTKREEQRRRGVRRIDFLGGRTRFMGLSGTLNGNVWELEVGDADNKV